jgi:hypothetical protein
VVTVAPLESVKGVSFDLGWMSALPDFNAGFDAGSGPIASMRIVLAGSIWRFAPAWAVLAGALSSGLALTSPEPVLRLVTAVLLADSAWGLLWQATVSAQHRSSSAVAWHARLPYASPGSLFSRLLRPSCEPGDEVGAAMHRLVGGLGLTLALSMLLGVGALMLSLAAGAAVLVMWIRLLQDRRSAFCGALLNLGLPWLLGIYLGGTSGVVNGGPIPVSALALAAGYFVLQWGILRRRPSGKPSRVLVMGQCMVLLAPIVLRMPVGTAMIAAISFPPLRALMGPVPAVHMGNTTGGALGDRASCSVRSQLLAWCAPWWWASMLVAALSVRLAM